MTFAQVEEEWVQRYDHNGGRDEAESIVVDALGHVYITGSVRQTSFNDDVVTIKYDANGQMLWTATYDGPAGSQDTGKEIARDAFGDIFVAATSAGSGTKSDYAVIKYDEGGTELWVQRYNGPSSRQDIVSALAVDAQGNAVITGRSLPDLSCCNYDMVTVQYNADGTEAWGQRVDGPSGLADVPAAIATDGADVVVVGSSSVSDWVTDIVTLKYTGIRGDLNCDAVVNAPDMDAFVARLTGN